MRLLFRLLVAGIIPFLLVSCGGTATYSPKPRAYPKVVYPTKEYQLYDAESCPFSFEYPAYAEVQQNAKHLEDKDVGDCWFDIYFPDFDCRIHCSYYEVGTQKSFDELKRDAFELMDWHNKKANYIDEMSIEKGNSVSGFAFEMEGPAASPFQFYLTDSTQHFLRSAMYFNTQARPDSLEPISNFIKEDIIKMIDSFKWVD